MLRTWLLVGLVWWTGCGDPVCTGREVACGGKCVDLQLDPSNCGACGRACESGDYCSVGACSATCLAGLDECGGRCVDTETDRANCGGCGHACQNGQGCVAGACSSSCDPLASCGDDCVDLQTDNNNCGSCGHVCEVGEFCDAGACTASNIKHVVLVVEENHTFENYFGKYCQAGAGSNPTCTSGPSCCEAAPTTDPSGASPVALDDFGNQLYDRDHDRVCEESQIHGGLMDQFVTGSMVQLDPIEAIYTYNCSDPNNWALADASTVQTYWSYADSGALADRYFQPTVGSTSANDMYFAVAHWLFDDNHDHPFTIGAGCLSPGGNAREIGHMATVADLLLGNGFTFRVYADGYADAVSSKPFCASAAGVFPDDCESFERTSMYSTCNYDPSDIPFQYFDQLADKPDYIVDSNQFARDVAAGELPSFSFVKARTYANEHPKWSTISRGVAFVSRVVDTIKSSQYADDTLILLTWDEGGGFYDHVSPPSPVAIQYDVDADGASVPYGTRVPALALGHFARAGTVSHQQMEHSSIVRFLEYNFLGPRYAGALGNRDATVANIGSLLDPATTGIAIPP